MSQSSPTPKQLKAQRARAASDASDQALVIRNLMSTPAGRRWMWLTLEACAVFSDSGNLDPQHLAWEVGKRTTGLALLAQVNRHAPADYIRMTEESTGIQLQLLAQEPEDQDDD